jgi:vitamin B12 transporter
MKICFPHTRRIGIALAAAFLSLSALAQSQSSLNQVVVTATRSAQPLSDLIADVTVLGREEIERSGAASLPDILARVPGVEITRNGGPGTTTSVFIRGGENRYTAVFIDGVRIDAQNGSGGAIWEVIPLALVERIEVLRGPASAVYGSDAMSGVIQIFTRKGEGGFTPFINTGVGTYATRKTEVGFSGAVEAFDYAIGMGDESSKGFNARPVAGKNGDDDGYNRQSSNARLGWQLARGQRLEATGLSSNMNSQYDNTLSKDDKNLHQLQTMGLNWQAQWTDAYSSRLSVSDSRNRYETEPSIYKTITQQRGYLFQNEYRLGAQLFTAALERRDDQLDNSGTTPATTTRSQNGGAIGYSYVGTKNTVQVQARQDQDNAFGTKNNGSIAYGYALTPQWRATASVGTAFRAPTLYQLNSSYGSTTLQPESSINQELGLSYAQGNSQWSLVTYRNRVNNLITSLSSSTGCSAGSYCYANTAEAEFVGLTLSGRERVGAFNLRGSLDVQDPKDRVTGNLLGRRATQHATLGVDSSWGRWSYGADSQFSGSRYDSSADVVSNPAYTLLNLYAKASVTRDWSVLIRVDNVTDANYQLANDQASFVYAAAGRTLWVGLSWAPGPVGGSTGATPPVAPAASPVATPETSQ